ncbi:MAG TPA: hypothetical protein VGD74_04415, partial [Vulgatibacter sp.]
GSWARLVEAEPTVVAYSGGLLVASDEGLLRIPELGDPEWVIDDAPVVPYSLFDLNAFRAIRDQGYDLLVADELGDVTTHVEGILDSQRAGDRVVFRHAAEDGLASLSVAGASWGAWTVPFPLAADAPFVVSGTRLFFDTPTEDGVAFVGANLLQSTATVLHGSASGRAIGPGRKGHWLFVADGWSWEETAGAPRAVLAGEMVRLQTVAGSSFVFHATAPDVTYWLDSD